MQWNRSQKNQNVSISSDSAYNSVAYFLLMIWWKPDCWSPKQKQKDKPWSQCTFPRFVTGLGLPLLLLTPTISFSLDQKQNVSDTVVSRIGMLFSLDHKLYASDYDSDSDSVASENQPLEVAHPHSDPSFALFLVELEFGNVGCWREGKTGVPGEKPLRTREKTNNKLNPQFWCWHQDLNPGPY